MVRLPPSVPHWFRKLVDYTRPSGMPKLRVLVALNISTRNCRLVRPKRVFLMKPTSMFSMPSARSVLRPTLPTRSPGQVAVGVAAQRAEEDWIRPPR